LRTLLFDRVLRHIAVPPVTDIFDAGADLYTDAHDFVGGLLGLAMPTRLVDSDPYVLEWEGLIRDLYERSHVSPTAHPLDFRVESETGLALYSLVRQRRPTLVVETGVANGYSTVLILSALNRNGHGRLLSVDVSANVASLVRDQEMERWVLSVLPRRRRRRALTALLGGGSEIDLFIHDSDHSYSWQALEYAIAWKRLSREGILLSDDVDSSRAFFDFCARNVLRPVLLMDRRKLIGAVAARAAPLE
jgi:predicted O-methyltransferase YrrM